MTLKEYINTYPPSQRMGIRNKIGKACGRKEPTVRTWTNRDAGVPARFILIVVELCDGRVSVEDLLKKNI